MTEMTSTQAHADAREQTFIRALRQHVYYARELQRLQDRKAARWTLPPGELESAFARYEASEEHVIALYRQVVER